MLILNKVLSISIFSSIVLLCALSFPQVAVSTDQAPKKNRTYQCDPTEPDMKGPFYKPNAPVRGSIGDGYILKGVVRSALNCSSIPGAPVEIWVAGPDGEYTDNYRATVISDKMGIYRLSSHIPPAYHGRPPHFHIRVSVNGFRALVTQHYPAKGSQSGEFDLVLIPEP